MDPEKIETTMTRTLSQRISLDAQLGDDGDRERLEIFQDPTREETSALDDLVLESMVEELRGALGELRPIEADVLRRRFGLGSDDGVTLQEIATSYGLSRERIRQIQEQALSKVRRTLSEEAMNS